MSEEKSRKDTIPIDLPSVMERIGGDENLLQELIDIYIEDFIEKYSKLKNAIERSDFIAIKEIAHSLRGSSGNMSLNGLHRTSEEIELSGREENIQKSKLLFIQLNKEFEKFKNILPSGKRLSIDQKWEGIPSETQPVLSRVNSDKNSDVTILAADDSMPNQVLMKFYASQAGFYLDMARNGREAVDFFRKKTYSIVFLDIHMPELDGFEALNQMRQIEIENILPETPIIALTGSTFKEKGTTCLDAGFDDFVEKSTIQETLGTIIQKHVKTSHEQNDTIHLDKSIQPLVPGYLENRKEDIRRIRHALEKKNFSAIEDLGHKMKGSGKCYGFEKISRLGHQIETFAKEQKAEEIEDFIGQMQDYLSNLRLK
ncbi:MAG: response regulator [Candidatus Aminicenantes bacterium]|nr:MAG: response regulator [Candidatus Aminicenantes bacterium]